MEDRSFDAVSRLVGGSASGRRSLLALGAAGLMAALTGPLAVEGKKKGHSKGNKKKARGQQEECPPAADLCAPQAQACVDFLTGDTCSNDPDCQESIACCSKLGTCDVSGFLSCLITAQSN